MAESILKKDLKRVTFTGSSNFTGGVNVMTLTQIDRRQHPYVSINSLTADRILLDLGNGWALLVNNSLQVLGDVTIDGELYYF